mgnify:FL=1
MNTISDIMFWISTGLLVPVIVLLILLFFRSLLLVGSFFGQYVSIRKTDKLIREQMETLHVNNVDHFAEKLPEKSNSLVVMFMKRILAEQQNKAQVQRLLANFEIAADKDLAISKTLTKLGPILGLMGTLIPMGPALVGLSTGDIASMAYNMQVVFATTVVGLVVSAVGLVSLQFKQRWYAKDVNNLDYVARKLNEKNTEA